MEQITKPMLAINADTNNITLPMLATTKFDGIRCLLIDKHAVSRKFKPIANTYIREYLEALELNNVDGELLCGNNFQDSTSGIMSESGQPDFKYYIFDYVKDTLAKPYVERVKDLLELSKTITDPRIVFVIPTKIKTLDELADFEEKALMKGFEGVIIRSPNSPYKLGRSTAREQYMLKIKRFSDSEAIVLDIEELTINNNEATKDAFGRSERSSHKANLAPGGMLGTLAVKDIHTNVEFRIGSGFNEEQRKYFWNNPDEIKGKIVKYKFFPTGCKDKPRHPIYLGIRDINDM